MTPDSPIALSDWYVNLALDKVALWTYRNWPEADVFALMVVTADGGALPVMPTLVLRDRFMALLAADPDPLEAWTPGEHDIWGGKEFRALFTAEEREQEQRLAADLGLGTSATWSLLRRIARDLAQLDWEARVGQWAPVVALVDATEGSRCEFFAKDHNLLAELAEIGWIPRASTL